MGPAAEPIGEETGRRRATIDVDKS
jgi:hypothetical protein